jgi:hypothetical protein
MHQPKMAEDMPRAESRSHWTRGLVNSPDNSIEVSLTSPKHSSFPCSLWWILVCLPREAADTCRLAIDGQEQWQVEEMRCTMGLRVVRALVCCSGPTICEEQEAFDNPDTTLKSRPVRVGGKVVPRRTERAGDRRWPGRRRSSVLPRFAELQAQAAGPSQEYLGIPVPRLHFARSLLPG